MVSETITVQVGGIVADVYAGSDMSLCGGESIQLNATGGENYLWFPSTGLSDPNIANPVATPATTTIYNVISYGNDLTLCTDTDQVIIFVDNNNLIVDNNYEICEGESVQLSASGSTSYTWSPSTGLDNPFSATPTATPVVTTTYTVTGTNAFGTCTNSETVTVTVTNISTVEAGPDQIICEGESAQLNASGGINYLWFPSTGLTNPNVANPVASPSVTTTYSVVSYANSPTECSDTDMVTITVDPTVSLSVAPEIAEICAGETVTLFANGANNLTWTPSTGLNTTSGASVNASPAVTTTYTVTGTSASGQCTASESVTVIVNQNAAATTGPDQTVCIGESAQLTASGGTNYVWTPSTGLSDPSSANPIATPAQTTTYTVLVYNDDQDCSSTASVTVFVENNLSLDVTPVQQICAGETTTLTSSGASTYVWSPATGLSSTSGATVVAAPTVTTTYTVTGFSASGECSATETVTVIVDPNAVAVVNPSSATICAGESVQLNASGGSTYTWTPADGLSDTSSSSPIATPSSTTTYTVTVSNGGSCTDTESVTIVVLPNVNVLVTPPAANICAGESMTLTASGAANYTWSPSTGLSSTSGSIVVASPNVTTVYTVVGTDSSGSCSSVNTVTIVVNEAIDVNAGLDQNICSGESTQLSATGGLNYVWSPATGLSDPNIANPIASPTTTTVYTVTSFGGDMNTCSDSDQIVVVVEEGIDLNVSNNQMICEGEAVQLFATGGSNYTWSPATGLSDASSASPIANPAVTTTYTVIATNANGLCAESATVTVIVNENTNVNAGPDQTICEGEAAQLTATGGLNYIWSPATGLNDATIANPVANPTTTTVYTVTSFGSNMDQCATTDIVVVVVEPGVDLQVSGAASICAGESVNLFASGADAYAWTPATGLSNTSSPAPIASPSETTTYTIVGTNSNGTCAESASITVVVDPASSVTAGPDQTICAGESVILSATGGPNFLWSPSTGLSSTSSANPIATPSVTTVYTVISYNNDITACSDTDEVVVIVEPGSQISVSGNTALCAGESTTLTATGADIYFWSPSTGLSDPFSGTTVASPSETTTYFVTGINSNGSCASSEVVTVVVTPFTTANAGLDQTICEGESAQLNASGGSVYSWSPASGLSDANSANPIATPAVTTVYTVTVSSGAGNQCSDTDEVVVVVEPGVNLNVSGDPAICAGESASLSASGASSYSWSPATGLSDPNSANPTASPTETTTYTVIGTNANGNCAESASITVVVGEASNVNAGLDQTICDGEFVQLNASGGINYVWSPATGLSNPNIANPVASPTVTTVYTVTSSSTGAVNCTSTDQVVVVVEPNVDLIASGNASICTGESTTLSASGATSYSWSPATGLSDPFSSNPVATPTVTTTYTVVGTNANGTCSEAASVTITVGDVSNVNAGFDQTICSGEAAQLMASGGMNYVWSPATGLSDPNISNPIATPSTTTVYTVTTFGNDPAMCSSSDQVVVVVEPGVDLVASGSAAICTGESTTLSASGADSYMWSPSTGLSDPFSANPVASPLVTTTYNVVGTNANGTCAEMATVTITVGDVSNVNAGLDQTICEGESAQLVATGGMNYVWSPATGLSNPNIANPVATPSTTTVYTVTTFGNDPAMCSSTDQVVVIVEPGVDLIAGGDAAICLGESTQLTASGASAYSWSPATGLSDPFSASPIATPLVTTTYTVIGTNSTGGCAESATVTIIVGDASQVNAGLDQTICEGESAQLAASGGMNYVWSPATGLSDPTIANPIASPSVTTVYTVTSTSDGAANCSSTDQVVVVVEPGVDLSVSGDTAICEGETAQLSASGAVSYTWSPATGLSDPFSSNPVASPTVTTTYTIVGSNANGTCAESASITVIVGDASNVNAGADQTICSGESAQLNATGGANYVWSPATGLSDPTIANPIASPTTTTVYTVTSTSGGAANCTSTDQVVVVVEDGANVSASVGDTNLCIGESTTVTLSGADIYSWSPATGVSDPNGSVVTLNPTVTTTYTITGLNANGNCPSTESITIVVDDCYAALGNYVWLDENENGLQDITESGVEGVQVFLYNANDLNNPIDSQFTDADGFYLFDNLDPNQSYVVMFIAPAGYEFTTQGAGAAAGDDNDSDANIVTGYADAVFLGYNEVNLTIDAGLVPPCVNEPIEICVEPVQPILICPTFCELDGPHSLVSVDNTSFECSVEIEGDCAEYVALPAFNGMDTVFFVACLDSDPTICDEAMAIITVVDDCDNPNPEPCENEVITTQCIEPLQTIDICPVYCELPLGHYITEVDNLFDCSIEFGPTDMCFEYTPLPAFDGTDTLTVTSCNPSDPNDCYEITVIVPVGNCVDGGMDEVEFANDDIFDTESGEAVLFDVLNNDDQGDSNWMSLTGICDEGTGGYTAIVNNQLLYMPGENFTGNDVICYEVCNEYGCDQALVYINVGEEETSDNNDVIANDDMASSQGEDVTVNILDNDEVNIDNPGMITIIDFPANGDAHVNVDGTITYQPEDDYQGMVSLTYVVCDENDNCDEAVVNIIVKLDDELDSFLSLLPNPAVNNVNIQFANTTETPVSIVIYDALGQLIYDYHNRFNAGIHNHLVELNDFAKGVYFVNIKKGDQIMTQKLIKE